MELLWWTIQHKEQTSIYMDTNCYEYYSALDSLTQSINANQP